MPTQCKICSTSAVVSSASPGSQATCASCWAAARVLPAREAVDLFCYRARQHLAALTAVLGGLDRLVFTGGIGANAPEIRERICEGLAYLGIGLDAKRNLAEAKTVSAPNSAVSVQAVLSDEELMIARHVMRLTASSASAERRRELMGRQANKLQELVDQAKRLPPIRVAVVNAAQKVLLDTLREAADLGFVEPTLIGESIAVRDLAKSVGIRDATDSIIEATRDAVAAAAGVRLVREGKADVLMKGLIHTDVLMHALLDAEHGLRVPGRRVSHAFLCDIPSYAKLLVITDAAINVAPDLNAKAQILQNAIELCHLLGVETTESRGAVSCRDDQCGDSIDARRRLPHANGATRPNHRCGRGRTASLRQRDLAKGGEGKRHYVEGRRRLRHPARA